MAKTQTKRFWWILAALIFSMPGTMNAQLAANDGERQILSRLDAALASWEQLVTENGDRLSQENGQEWSGQKLLMKDQMPSLEQTLPGMDLSPHPRMRHFEEIFSQEKKEEMRAVLGLFEIVGPLLEEELKKQGLPAGLQYLPAVQSGYDPTAIAENGATGMWQLHYLPAKRFGLRVSSSLDERRDLRAGTRAACEHLGQLHEKYQDWQLAIAAYHCGPALVNKAMNLAENPNNFWQVWEFLPLETRDYVPAFMAAALVLGNPEAYSLEPLNFPSAPELVAVPLRHDLHMEALSEVLHIPENQLCRYNPTCRAQVFAAGEKVYPLYLPKTFSATFYQYVDSINHLSDTLLGKAKPAPAPEPEPKVVPKEPAKVPNVPIPEGSVLVEYEIQQGDALYYISRWFEVKVEAIQSWNGMSNVNIRAGDKLKIYVPADKKDYFERLNSLDFEEKQALQSK